MAEQLAMLALLADADVLVGTKPTADRQGSTTATSTAGGTDELYPSTGSRDGYPSATTKVVDDLSTGRADLYPSDAAVTAMSTATAPEGSPHGTENARPTVGRAEQVSSTAGGDFREGRNSDLTAPGPDRCDRCLGGEVAKGQHELFRVGKYLLCGRCKRGARPKP